MSIFSTQKFLSGPASAPVYAGPAIVIRNLRKQFNEHVVLDDFNLIVNDNENVVILGKSGAGKSVLIKCVIGLLKPDHGSIQVYGNDVVNLSHHELDQVRTRIGFLFQGNAIYDSMTVRENLEFPLRRHWFKLSQKKVDDMVMEALEDVELADTAEMMPSELSGGMLKRIALARTMILKPGIILYDEPTTGLDPVTSRDIDSLIIRLHKKFKTSAIIISHDMNCVKNTADRVVLLLEGKIYTEGSYDQMAQSQDEKVKQFFE